MMGDKTYLLLLLLFVLLTKHLVFDFFLQSVSQIRNKRIYGHPSGLIHAAGHAAGTSLAFFIITPPIAVGIACAPPRSGRNMPLPVKSVTGNIIYLGVSLALCGG